MLARYKTNVMDMCESCCMSIKIQSCAQLKRDHTPSLSLFYIVFATSYISFSFRRLFCSIYLLFFGCFSIISFNTCDLLSRVPITFFTFYFSVFFPASSLFVYFTSKGGLWQLLMLLKPFVFFKVLFPSIFFLFVTN